MAPGPAAPGPAAPGPAALGLVVVVWATGLQILLVSQQSFTHEMELRLGTKLSLMSGDVRSVSQPPTRAQAQLSIRTADATRA